MSLSLRRMALLLMTAVLASVAAGRASAARPLEGLGRGGAAVKPLGGEGLGGWLGPATGPPRHRLQPHPRVGWRVLGTDPDDIAFNLYRAAGGASPVRLNDRPLGGPTNFVDASADASKPHSYFVRPVVKGKEQGPSAPFTLAANAPARQYLSIPLQTPRGYSPGDSSAGDLDGDGEYELVVHMQGRGTD